MTEVIKFAEAIAKTNEIDKALLLGNGFSIAQSKGEFSYTNLLDKSELHNSHPAIRKVFDNFNTVDFEKVIHSIEGASVVMSAYGHTDLSTQLTTDADTVRSSLVNAIRAVHPQNFKSILEENIQFLKEIIN